MIFVLIALTESGFLAALGLDILSADKAAVQEFKLLKVSEYLSSGFPTWNRLSKAMEEVRLHKHLGQLEAFREYDISTRECDAFFASVAQQLDDLGVDSSAMRKMRSGLRQMHEKMSPYMDPADPNHKTSFLSFSTQFDLLKPVFDNFGQQFLSLHNILQSQTSMIFEQNARLLLYVAMVVNVVLVSFLVVWVEKAITGPIVRLSKDCQKIRFGAVLSKPKSTGGEINALQESFYAMSVSLAEFEKRRASYLALFRTVQTASLSRVRTIFESLATETAMPDLKLRNKLTASLRNLDSLFRLLDSMSEALTDRASEKMVPEFADADTSRIVNDAVAAVDSLANLRKVKIEIEGTSHNCRVDEHLLVRVLTNLLSNAIKYSPDEGIVVLKVEARKSGQLCFSVTDRGPGMKLEDQQKLFKKFSQLEALDGVRRSGTGLGLNICKEIIEAHAGQIACKSEPGKGSCFFFDLPAYPANAAKMSELAETSKEKQSLSESELPVKSREKKEQKVFGIKKTFAILLICFLTPQVLLAFNLNHSLHQVSMKAKSYAEKKEILTRAQDMSVNFMSWQFATSYELTKIDMSNVATAMGKVFQGINKRSAELRWLRDHTPPHTPLWDTELNLLKLQRRLKTVFTPDQLFEAKSEAKKKGRVVLDEVQANIREMLRLASLNVQDSYDWSNRLRAETVSELVGTGVLNLILVLCTAFIAVRITGRVAELKQKSEAFAKGDHLQTTLKGNDELSFLDRSLCETSDAIKAAEAQRQDLINVINHDLRTPISSALGSCELIHLTSKSVAKKELDQLKIAETELKSMLSRINDLLTIEKIDAGAYNLAWEEFEFSTLLDKAVTKVLANSDDADLELDTNPPSEAAIVRGEESLLSRLLEIVLSNAVDASASSTVVLKANVEEGQLHVTIKDEAGGITPELLPQIFERFRFVGGKPVTGLGLPLARRICNMLGASIDLASDSSGTLVNLRLPLATPGAV